MSAPVLTVARKEFLENLRDRRSLLTALLFGPLFGPMMLALTLWIALERGDQRQDKPIDLPVIHSERAPNLLAYLGQFNVRPRAVRLGETAARRAIEERREQLILEIPHDYAAKLAAGEPAPLRLYSDSSEPMKDAGVQRVTALITRHAQGIAQTRLELAGIDPTVVLPIVVQDIDVATAKTRGALALGMLSALVLLAMLAGGMYLAIDTTAGERERGSLEPLLALPVRREHLVYGKIVATIAYMLISLVVTVAACAVLFQLIGLERFGMTANLGPWTALRIALAAAPLALTGAALMTVVASFTRSYREAQTYLSLLVMLPTLPLAFAGLLGLAPTRALMWLPSLSQHFLITALLRDDPVPALDVAISAGSAAALGGMLAWLAGRLYRRENLFS
ncbi:MAG: ABC transporter permease subunit [Steroidobacteraceae bacterium]